MASTPKRIKQSTARPVPRNNRRRLYLLMVSAYLLPIILIALSSSTFVRTVEAVSTDVVISQVYTGGGAGDTTATYRCDYVELYNRGASSVNLSTYSLQGATTSGGTTWNKTDLTGSIAPGTYYLIRLSCATAAQNPAGLDITNQDASGTLSLAQVGGKVALLSNQTLITTGTACPSAGVVDLVGYGTTDCFETAVKPAPSNQNTMAIFRLGGGNIDTDNNAADFTDALANPRSSTSQQASISFDNSAASCIFTSLAAATTFSWTHTITSTAGSRVLIVGVSTYATAGTPGATSVTYGGVALTRQGIVTNNNTAAEIWRATDAQIASRANDTVTVTLGVGVTQYAVGGSASFSGVSQATPNRNFIGNTGNTGATSATDPSVTVPSANRELVIDTVATEFTGSNNLIVGANQAQLWNGANDSDCDGSPGTEPNLTTSSVGAGSIEAGAAPSVPMTWNATANNVNWAIGAISLIPIPATEVELTSFKAQRVGGGNLVRWETGYEVDNLGFNLYREVQGKRTRVNPSLVAGSAFVAGQGVPMTAGRSYRWFDRQATAGAQYWLEDVDLDGQRKLYGPILAEAKDSGGSASDESQSLMLDQLNSMMAGGDGTAQARQHGHPASLISFEATRAEKGQGPLRSERISQEGSSASSVTPEERQREIAQQDAVKLLVNHDGWYRVGQQELVAAGLDPSVGPRLLQLYADGLEVPMLVNSSTGSQFGLGDSIEFYGMGLDTVSTDTRTYWLIVGSTPGARIRKTKVRSMGEPTATGPAQPERPVRPSQPSNSPGTASPATTGGTGSTQQGSTLFNWLPALPLPTLVPEQQSPAPARTTTTKTTYRKWAESGVAEPEVAAASPTTEIAGAEPAAASRAKNAPEEMNAPPVLTATPSPITTVRPVADMSAINKLAANTQPTAKATQPAFKRSANRRRVNRGATNKRKQRASSHRKHRSHAAMAEGGSGGVAESFGYTIERADRNFYFSALQNGEASNFFGQIIGQEAATLKLNVHHLAKSSGQSTLEVSLQGATADDHLISVRLNGSDVGRLSFAGRSKATAQFQFANSLLHNGENTIVLTALGGQTDISLVDRVNVTYPHTYEADNNALAFSLERQQGVTVAGFSSSSIRMLDISDPNSPEELVAQAEPGGLGYSLAFERPQGGTLLAVADNQIEHPAQVTRNQPSSWYKYEEGADLLVLAHRDFINALAPLVALRQSQGLAVAVIDVEDVYDEFGYGAHGRAALRDFLDWTRSHWTKSPRFVLLVGDCSYDPRNYLGHGQLDFVPTSLIDTRSLETASDDALADFDSDGVPEMAVGRLPVRTAAEAATVVSKIISFQNGSLGRGALLVSDQVSDFDFEAANRAVRALLPQGMDAQLINRGSNDTSTVHSQIVNGINQGPLLVNYVGHGSIETWTGAGILRSADAAQLTNDQALSVFVLMTCLNGFVQDVSNISLGEALMRNGNGGAVAVWASSGLTEPDQQALMNQQLVRSLLGEQPVTLGEAVMKAKGATRNMDARRTWMLLGDPTIRLR
jgi:Peptidase family C25/Lamin Tail Domain